MDDQIVRDLEKHIKDAEEISDFLKKLYYDAEFSTLFNRPVLSMLSTAALYLRDNLQALKVKYLSK